MADRLVSVQLDDEAIAVLRWIAQQQGISMTEATRRTIIMGGYIFDRQYDGAKVLVVGKDGTEREIVGWNQSASESTT